MAAPEYTLETFKHYTRECGVRKIQGQIDKITTEAKEQGKATVQLMKERGYKSLPDFSKQCPQFPLVCWPSEFGELGSGFVLYFHFLAFLAFMFLALACLQAPAMVIYAGENWLVGWQWHSWQNMFSSSSACECVGYNDAITGPLTNVVGVTQQSDYGKTCSAWDMGLCPTQTGCPFSEPGQWVCRKWCFAPSDCPTPDNTGTPSMTNRHYRGLVKSYSACLQDESVVAAQCTGFKAEDIAFNEQGIELGNQNWAIGSAWMTPGNFGPEQADHALIPTLYTVCVCVICGCIFLTFQSNCIVERKIDKNNTSPNDYAILVRGLPRNATDEGMLQRWFSENAVAGRTVNVVKVVIGWDVEDFHEKLKKMKTLREEIAHLETENPVDPQINTKKQELSKVLQDLASTTPDKVSKLKSSGIVVVIFQHQNDQRACLRRWTSFWAQWRYSEALDACFLPEGNQFWPAAQLPMFPVGEPPRPIHKIGIVRAPNPGDIHWEELGISRDVVIKRLIYTNSAMLLLVCISFGIVYGLNKLQELVRDKTSGEGSNIGLHMLSFLPAFGVAFMNGVMTIAARKFGGDEYWETWTQQEASQALKMTVATVINTGLVPWLVSAQPKEWYQLGGLVDDIFTMLLFNSLFPSLITFLDAGYALRSSRRMKLTQEAVDKINATLAAPATTPEQKEEVKQARAKIKYFHDAYAPSNMNNARRYATAMKTTLCCIAYMPLFPMLSVIGFFGIVLQYVVDKYLLLRWFKRPERPANQELAAFSLRFLKFIVPLLLTFTTWLFLSPSWSTVEEVWANVIIMLIVSCSFSFGMPLSIWTKFVFRVRDMGKGFAGDDALDYYKAQYFWATEMKYHKDHFLYKRMPESMNPEFLKPGVDSAVTMDKFKACYGSATQEAASSAGTTSEVTTLKGGVMIASDLGAGTGAGAAAAEHAPTVYGAPSIEPEDPGPKAAASATPPPEIPGPHPGSALPSGKDGAVAWQFETNHGWSAFGADCQSFIEKKYQEYKKTGRGVQVNVRTSGFQVSVHFGKMTTKKADSHKLRKIRRSASE